MTSLWSAISKLIRRRAAAVAVVLALAGMATPAFAQSVCVKAARAAGVAIGKPSAVLPPTMEAALCSGAEGSPQPAKCYQRVMGGTISWGGGKEWAKANAVNLCSGARDGNARIACFQGKILSGRNYNDAIRDCRAIPKAEAPKLENIDNDGDGHAADDCDDADPSRYPTNTEVDNKFDEDCDDATLGEDRDGDGFVSTESCNGDSCGYDCNDDNRMINHLILDILNGRDDNCNNEIDEDQTAEEVKELLSRVKP